MVAAGLFEVSYTLFAFNTKFPVQSTLVFAVYVNVNVLLVALHPTVALLNVSNVVGYVIAQLVNAFVDIHTLSVHVNTILHVAPPFKFILFGVHHVHTGAVLSFPFAVRAVPS